MHSCFKNRISDAVAHLRCSKSFRLSFSCTNSHSHAFQGFLFFYSHMMLACSPLFCFLFEVGEKRTYTFWALFQIMNNYPSRTHAFLLYSLLKIRHYFVRYFSPCMQFCHINVHLKGSRLCSILSAMLYN